MLWTVAYSLQVSKRADSAVQNGICCDMVCASEDSGRITDGVNMNFRQTVKQKEEREDAQKR